MGASFSMALVFIYFTNSELLTSNFMYFTVGRYYDKVSWADTMKIWSLCLIGNLFGVLSLSPFWCGAVACSARECWKSTWDAPWTPRR